MSERGTYRSIACALLAGKDFRKLPERARWIFVVLKMNMGPAGIDTWYPDELLARVSSESGSSTEDVAATLDLLEEKSWIEREDNIVWIKKHLEHDPHLSPENPKHRKSIQRHLAGLPRIPIVMAFCAQNQSWIPKREAIAMGMSWVFDGIGDPMANRNRSRNRIPIRKEDLQPSANDAKNTAKATEKPSPFPKSVCDALYETWVRVRGAIDYGAFRKALIPLFPTAGARYTELELIAAIKAHAEWVEGLSPREAGFESIQKFAQSVQRWVRLGAMPLQDPVSGELTERGLLV